MVRATLVDKQCVSQCLLDALSPPLQPFLDHFYLPFKRLSSADQLCSLFGMFSASQRNLPPQFSRGFEQLPHPFLGSLDLVDWPLRQDALRA